MKESKKTVLATPSRSLPTLSREVPTLPRSLSTASVFFRRLRSAFATLLLQLDRMKTATKVEVTGQPSLPCSPLSPRLFATFAFLPPTR